MGYIVDIIHPTSNKFVMGGKVKATADSKLMTALTFCATVSYFACFLDHMWSIHVTVE